MKLLRRKFMRQDNSYVEALWVPETNDFGFFDVFYNLERKNGFIGSSVDKKKSIIMSTSSMYICQFVKNGFFSTESELIHELEWDSMNVFLKKGGIPDSTRYRLATEELWIFLMVATGQMNTRCMDLVSKRLSKSMETDLYYDRNRNAVCNRNGAYAPWNEIVIALSHEYQTK